MATVKQIVERAYTKVNGEFEALSEGSDDFRTYVNVLNQVVGTWAHTPYVKWQSLFDIDYKLPDVVAEGQFTYPVANADEIRVANTPFDNVFFKNGSVVIKRYKMTDQALYQASSAKDICAFMAGSLHIKNVPDDIVGLDITFPAYVMPSLYTLGSQEVNIDSAPWLVTYMAASVCDASPVPFISRNADKYYKQAEILMKEMRENNRHRQHLIIKKAGRTLDDQRFGSLSQAINAGVGTGGGELNFIDGGEF